MTTDQFGTVIPFIPRQVTDSGYRSVDDRTRPMPDRVRPGWMLLTRWQRDSSGEYSPDDDEWAIGPLTAETRERIVLEIHGVDMIFDLHDPQTRGLGKLRGWEVSKRG